MVCTTLVFIYTKTRTYLDILKIDNIEIFNYRFICMCVCVYARSSNSCVHAFVFFLMNVSERAHANFIQIVKLSLIFAEGNASKFVF